MNKKHLFLAGVAFFSLTASAQQIQGDYVNWGTSSDQFHELLKTWTPGAQVSEDDNFFISRVKPKLHFRNTNTQVNQQISAENDKRLVAWIPVNNAESNALPDGVFDSEVFSMWSYVTHWGNWTAPLGRVPGNFLDVAHKNGVAVSSVASIPWGALYGSQWETTLDEMSSGTGNAEKTAQLLHYYGVDGLGYNSEFSTQGWLVKQLQSYHKEVVQLMKDKNPLFENMWYDGTNDNGMCTFDRGLTDLNDATFGHEGEERASLFFNYNWNTLDLNSSVTYARNIGRDPLYLYAGVNMQGGEPRGTSWPLLKDVPISIGLWGAHSQNMFWESRGELGSAPDVKQRAYLLRTEKWFGGSNRNPVITPTVISSMSYGSSTTDFHGMAAFMSARSALKWNLGEEPFITYFNLGNGKYFNWLGVRQHDKEWYNIGAQDYLPTWRWWLTKNLLGRTAADVVSNGLAAEFTWDDAYVGGSTVRISGTSANEYLHLFKTEFALRAGDVITFRYKLAKGSADMKLVLTAKGAENVAINESGMTLLNKNDEADEDIWVERKFTVGSELADKEIALVALHFENAADMNLYLGEFSIIRGTAAKPAAPELATCEMLANNRSGVDAKLIFNMANNKPVGEPCYNLDVNTSLFKVYAQQEGCEPILMTITTSWASLVYSVPVDVTAASKKMRFGVSAVSLDMKSESDITWSAYTAPPTYVYTDDVQTDKKTIKPGEAFEMSYVDPNHPEGTWVLTDGNGAEVFRQTGHTVSVPEGLSAVGSYNLTLSGKKMQVEGESEVVGRDFTVTYPSFVQISKLEVGALPEVLTLTANDKEADLEVKAGDEIALAYTGRPANGSASQGVYMRELPFGAKCADLGITDGKSFSVTFWLKINKLAKGSTQLLTVCDRGENWPKNNWGWIWSNVDETGKIANFTFRGSDATNNKELKYKYENSSLPVGNWVHVAYVFDYKNGGFRADLYLNGIKQKITGWERTGGALNTSEPGYERDVYNITDGMLVAVGGAAHGRSGIDGVVDNFMVWNKVIGQDEVNFSMGNVTKDNLSADVLAFWDIETRAGASNVFPAEGSKAGVAASSHEYISGKGEGQGHLQWVAPEYTSGCPFIDGSAFPVVTTPSWKAKKGAISEVSGNDQSGAAKLTYAKSGDYSVTLTLTNSLGSDQRTFQVIKVEGSVDGIDDVNTAETEVHTAGGVLFIDFAEAGNYDVRVFNAAGQPVAAQSQALSAGAKMQLTLGTAGVYVLQIQKDGKTVRSAKILNK